MVRGLRQCKHRTNSPSSRFASPLPPSGCRTWEADEEDNDEDGEEAEETEGVGGTRGTRGTSGAGDGLELALAGENVTELPSKLGLEEEAVVEVEVG